MNLENEVKITYEDMKDLKQYYLNCYWTSLNYNKSKAIDYYGNRAKAILNWCLLQDRRCNNETNN